MITFKPTEPQKEEEEHIELMVVLAHIFLHNAMSRCGLPRKLKTSRRKVKLNKLPRVRFQLERNDLPLFKPNHPSYVYKKVFLNNIIYKIIGAQIFLELEVSP